MLRVCIGLPRGQTDVRTLIIWLVNSLFHPLTVHASFLLWLSISPVTVSWKWEGPLVQLIEQSAEQHNSQHWLTHSLHTFSFRRNHATRVASHCGVLFSLSLSFSFSCSVEPSGMIVFPAADTASLVRTLVQHHTFAFSFDARNLASCESIHCHHRRFSLNCPHWKALIKC